MKKYHEYFEEISDTELYDGLVGYGLFSEKIPKFLTSKPFLDYIKNPTIKLQNTKKKEPTDYIRYSSMRNINVPRDISIPEPFAYAMQCKSISDHRSEIIKHFKDKTINSEHKISRIHVRKLSNKPYLFEMNYKNFKDDADPVQDIIIKSRYLALADISTCFPSIYSHSIAWALVGKVDAKENKSNKLWQNKIDICTRNVKYGETNGILIGPHASNIISEIILVAVDYELTKKGFKFIRNIDDYECYVDSYEKAEEFYLTLSEELKKYELSLNHKKSKIEKLPNARMERWVRKLNHFSFANTYIYENTGAIGIKYRELQSFMDYTVELMLKENSNAAIINYAMKILSTRHMYDTARKYYLKQIHHLVLLYPYLANLLEKYLFDPHHIDIESIKAISEDIYKLGLKNKTYESCCYAIYWAIKYNFEIKTSTDDSINSDDCIFMLISYYYNKERNNNNAVKLYKEKARKLNNCDFDKYWIFIYEVLPYSELKGNYKNMKRNKISFIREPEVNNTRKTPYQIGLLELDKDNKSM